MSTISNKETNYIKWMKIQIKTLKVMPMSLALIYFINTILGFFGISQVFLGIVGGCSIITLLFLFISSYALGFCGYHRMFLYYIASSNIFCVLNEFLGFPLIGIYGYASLWVIAGVFLIVILYQWLHSK